MADGAPYLSPGGGNHWRQVVDALQALLQIQQEGFVNL
jgi:hypothetical protein